jgi:hypothetical protein
MGRVAAELLARLARLVHARRRVLQNAWTQIAVGGLVTRRDVIMWMASLASAPESERRAREVRANVATRALALALPAAEDSVRRDRFRALVRRVCFALALLRSGGSGDAAVDRDGFVHCAVATTLVHESEAAAAFDRAVGRGEGGQRAHTKEDIERRALVAPEAIRTFCDIRGSHVDAKLDAGVRRAATRATAHVKSISPARRNETGLTKAPRPPPPPPAAPSPLRDAAAEHGRVLDRDRIALRPTPMGGGVPQRALPPGAPSPQQLLHSGKKSPELFERNPIPLRVQGTARTAFGSAVPTTREPRRTPSPAQREFSYVPLHFTQILLTV